MFDTIGAPRRAAGVAVCALAALAGMGGLGCSASSNGNGSMTGASASAPSGHDANPSGVPYPTANVGLRARGKTAAGAPNGTPGSVLANYKFLGYPGGDRSHGLQTVALADYYDPTGTTYKVIHILAAATWCGPCNDETDALVSVLASPATDLRAQGVVYLQALVEGPTPNLGATKVDLDAWSDAHRTPFTTALDPEASELGALFDAASVPFNADLDARSMELLQAGTGYEDPEAVKVWVDFVAKNPPAYMP
ncbi:MAG TPA: hypothetical protein VGI39_09480 [Polyangiaceae bacterium]|jgi:hypothetical protein